MRTAISYRLRMVLSVVGLVASVVPIYFIAGALQSTMARSIRAEGGQYFGFLVVGMISLSLIQACVNVLPGQVGGAITTGTLEALLATPSRVGVLLIGMSGWGLVWAALRTFILLIAAWALGATVHWDRLLVSGMIVALIVLCYLPLGAIAAAFVIAFRTSVGIPTIAVSGAAFLGGAYYPTSVIPSWLHDLSYAMPVTYGLRPLRRVLLDNAPLGSVRSDLAALLLFAIGLTLLSAVAVRAAMAYGRRAGSLSQY
jgi:ABC-2 type transport system permease protein